MLVKIVRLGADAESATTPSNRRVVTFNAAYSVGYGNNIRTVWCKCSVWNEKMGEALLPYLLKGSQIQIVADDVDVDAWQGKNGLTSVLKLNVIKIELLSKLEQKDAQGEQYKAEQQRNAQQQATQKSQTRPTPAVQQSPNAAIPNANDYSVGSTAQPDFSEFDDDIPF